eukprot:2450423-Prymnesium_polylepis.1
MGTSPRGRPASPTRLPTVRHAALLLPRPLSDSRLMSESCDRGWWARAGSRATGSCAGSAVTAVRFGTRVPRDSVAHPLAKLGR